MLCKCAAASGPLYPGALWLPKQTIPQNSRLETGAVIAASAWQRASSAARRSWVRVFRPPRHPLPARLHLREGSGGLGPSLEQGRALIGLNTPETHQQLLPGGKECEGEASDGLCDGSQPRPPCSLALTWSPLASAHPAPSWVTTARSGMEGRGQRTTR